MSRDKNPSAGQLCGDLTAAVEAYRQTIAKYIQPDADLNEDGIVNFKDFAIMGLQWLTTRPES